MPFRNPLPFRLKTARLNAKLSQRALGLRVGIDESSASARMNQYEKGRHTPDVNTLKMIADELSVPLNYFFCEDEITAELVIKLSKLSGNEKDIVLKVTSEVLDARVKGI